jgi:hypothetical protein
MMGFSIFDLRLQQIRLFMRKLFEELKNNNFNQGATL